MIIIQAALACTPSAVCISLGSITRPGSLGMISARNEHPFETVQK